MSDHGNFNTSSQGVITWIIDGVRHDRVERFYSDPDTGAAAVQCYHDCCHYKEKKK